MAWVVTEKGYLLQLCGITCASWFGGYCQCDKSHVELPREPPPSLLSSKKIPKARLLK